MIEVMEIGAWEVKQVIMVTPNAQHVAREALTIRKTTQKKRRKSSSRQ